MTGDTGYLQHGKGTSGPFLTQSVPIKCDGCGSDWLALYEGRWRRVHIQAGRTYIVHLGKRIDILIDGV